MDDAMWGMILGKSGKIPGTIDEALVSLAHEQGREFTDVDPHTLLPNALEGFKKEMDENGWDYGQDNEELFELAMHPEQYRPFKSGQAKKQLLADIQKAKDAKLSVRGGSPAELAAFKHAKADAVKSPLAGQLIWSFGGEGVPAPCIEPFIGQTYKEGDTFCYLQTKWGEIVEIPAALGGKLVDISVKPGQNIRQGDTIAWIERQQ
ncbi:MAG: oxaloacetate decarboxylase, partial [Prevotella sp.]|nr:oxaloacetate decarboxylase [Prevotella sp.]